MLHTMRNKQAEATPWFESTSAARRALKAGAVSMLVDGSWVKLGEDTQLAAGQTYMLRYGSKQRRFMRLEVVAENSLGAVVDRALAAEDGAELVVEVRKQLCKQL